MGIALGGRCQIAAEPIVLNKIKDTGGKVSNPGNEEKLSMAM